MATPTTLPASWSAGQVLTAASLNNLRGAFRILQVVSTTKTDTFVSSSLTAGSAVDITGLSATITPSSTSSQVLVFFSVYGNTTIGSSITTLFAARLVRGTTNIGVGATAGNRTVATGSNGNLGIADGFGLVTGIHLDSPATTSATTYKIQAVNIPFQNASGVMYVNRASADPDSNQYPRLASFITLMEVSA